MFSFTPSYGAVPILKVNGGPLDSQRVWLLPDKGEEDWTAEIDSMRCECGKQFRRRVMLRRHKTSLSATKGVPICPYRRSLGEARDSGRIPNAPFNGYKLPDGQFQVTPYEISDKDGAPCYNQRLYIAGATGCGKSRWAASWLREYQSSHPERQVAGFCQTPLVDDKTYAGINLEQLDPSDPELENVWDPKEDEEESGSDSENEGSPWPTDDGGPPSEEELQAEADWEAKMRQKEKRPGGKLRGRICLFDDIDQLTDMDKRNVFRLLGETIHMGRKAGIPVCFCNHNFTNNKQTKDILNGATAIVIFPRNAAIKPLEYLLTSYVGFSRDQVKRLMDLNPKWVYVHRSHPAYAVTEDSVFSLRELTNPTPSRSKTTKSRRS